MQLICPNGFMKQTKYDFYIWYNSLKAGVTILYLPDHAAFSVEIQDAPPITIRRQLQPDGRKMWTSSPDIPEEITVKLGRLIDMYLRSLAKRSNG